MTAHPRRWSHHRHVDAYDVLAWTLFTIICGAMIGALCAFALLVA